MSRHSILEDTGDKKNCLEVLEKMPLNSDAQKTGIPSQQRWH